MLLAVVSSGHAAEAGDETTTRSDEQKKGAMNSIYTDGGVTLSKDGNTDKRDKVSGQSQTFDAREMDRKFAKQAQHQQTDQETSDKLGTKNQADASLENVFRKAWNNKGKGQGTYTRNDGHSGGDKEYSFDDKPKLPKPSKKPKKEKKKSQGKGSDTGTEDSGKLNMSEFGIEEGEGKGTFQVGGNEDENTMEQKTQSKEEFKSGVGNILGQTTTRSPEDGDDDEYDDSTDDSLISSKEMKSMWSDEKETGHVTYDFPVDDYDDEWEYYWAYEDTTTQKPRPFPLLSSFG